ncbi:hypothetical protein IQ249_04405 [Lusitaniella coriacea LEGE 07157]|uniref:Uncharacterized protein n=1 Tax=Lusitaniella coriacea LEGE 07157 TaxID=945747 RepID=A0A8J7B869_9CYAN|nr:hypothetical protein [Lusitaniella coriacea]MBE9115135.1 hypothetical protein [Lusitaniella coriacea LEGE 07157]
MWEDSILEELQQIREEHAKSFNYDFKAIFADWQKRQAASEKNLVSLQPKRQSNNTLKPAT